MTSVVGHSSLVVGKTSGRDENITVSSRTRWIVAATGCVAALIGVPVLSLLAPILSSFLVLGAVLAGRFPRYGRDLMWFGAGITTLWGGTVGTYILHFSFKPGNDKRVMLAVLVSLVLLVWCDVALIKEGLGQRPRTNDQRLAHDEGRATHD
jgi:hypothetical protein